MTYRSKQRHNRQRVHVINLTLAARPIGKLVSNQYYVLLHKLYKMINNLRFIVRHQK